MQNQQAQSTKNTERTGDEKVIGLVKSDLIAALMYIAAQFHPFEMRIKILAYS